MRLRRNLREPRCADCSGRQRAITEDLEEALEQVDMLLTVVEIRHAENAGDDLLAWVVEPLRVIRSDLLAVVELRDGR